jgi:serine/threonine protein kinase
MRWAREAATAVAFLHSCKLLHRDIKSPNFLLVKNEIKITDFGMSTAAGIASTNSSKHAQQARENTAGSVRWMAPETTAASPAFSEKSDVFGLGMVFWEIASREIPFSQVLQEAQVVVLIKYEKVRPDIPTDCPKTLSDIIAQCWDDSPKKRPTGTLFLFHI